MICCARRFWMTAGAFVALVSPCAGSDPGPYLAEEFSLDAFMVFHQGPIVHSFAKVVAFDGNNNRIYNTQVILGHQVASETSLIFNAKIVTEIGLANSTTGDLSGGYNTCYFAQMAGHANAYNVHLFRSLGPRCIGDPPPSLSRLLIKTAQ
jgi:hypothetical protein